MATRQTRCQPTCRQRRTPAPSCRQRSRPSDRCTLNSKGCRQSGRHPPPNRRVYHQHRARAGLRHPTTNPPGPSPSSTTPNHTRHSCPRPNLQTYHSSSPTKPRSTKTPHPTTSTFRTSTNTTDHPSLHRSTIALDLTRTNNLDRRNNLIFDTPQRVALVFQSPLQVIRAQCDSVHTSMLSCASSVASFVLSCPCGTRWSEML